MLADGTVVIEPMLPQKGGYLEQDAELMACFSLLEEIEGEIKRGREQREKGIQKAREMAGLPPLPPGDPGLGPSPVR